MDLHEFKFYKSYMDTFENMPDEEAWKLVKRMCDFYFKWKDKKSESVLVEAIFPQIKYTMEKSLIWKKTWGKWKDDPKGVPTRVPMGDPTTKDKDKDKDKVNNKLVTVVSSANWEFASLKDLMIEKINKQEFINKWIPEQVLTQEMNKFYNYWVQINPNWKKEHWQKQKTFDVKRRFITWIWNCNLQSNKKQVWITSL